MSNQPKFGEWIKCSERLPERGVPVLIYVNRWGVSKATLELEVICDKMESVWMNSAGGSDYSDERGNITHWMVLPEAPK